MNMQTPPVAIKGDSVYRTRQPLIGVCITAESLPHTFRPASRSMSLFDYSPGRAFLRGLGSPQLQVAA